MRACIILKESTDYSGMAVFLFIFVIVCLINCFAFSKHCVLVIEELKGSGETTCFSVVQAAFCRF